MSNQPRQIADYYANRDDCVQCRAYTDIQIHYANIHTNLVTALAGLKVDNFTHDEE
jgi:hypothetical protein